jgi:hypothetical protein
MGLFKTRKSDYSSGYLPDGKVLVLKESAFAKFDPRILGLGDIKQSSAGVEAICAVFDLSGFTQFCRQVDPHHAVPLFMSAFLEWLFNFIKTQTVAGKFEDGVGLYSRLPFFAKFMGDGVLFLWDSAGMEDWAAVNIPIMGRNTCLAYQSEFYPMVKRRVSDAPGRLRVGIARGRVFSVGGGTDFVGPSINIASRLQKIGSTISFSFAKRGFNTEDFMADRKVNYVLRAVSIRGIGDNELVYVEQRELDQLPEDEQSLFREP